MGEKRVNDLNMERLKNRERLDAIGEMLNESLGNVSNFLSNQIDFSLVRQQAMEKIHKQELIEQAQSQQQQQHQQQPISSANFSTLPPILSKANTQLTIL